MKLTIEGMHCQACVRRVEKALGSVEGAHVDKVEIGSAHVGWRDAGGVDAGIDAAHEQAVLDAVKKAGYQARRVA